MLIWVLGIFLTLCSIGIGTRIEVLRCNMHREGCYVNAVNVLNMKDMTV